MPRDVCRGGRGGEATREPLGCQEPGTGPQQENQHSHFIVRVRSQSEFAAQHGWKWSWSASVGAQVTRTDLKKSVRNRFIWLLFSCFVVLSVSALQSQALKAACLCQDLRENRFGSVLSFSGYNVRPGISFAQRKSLPSRPCRATSHIDGLFNVASAFIFLQFQTASNN